MDRTWGAIGFRSLQILLTSVNQRKATRSLLLLSAIFTATAAFAADADNGRRLATARCVSCHGHPGQSHDVAQATPFEVIARKFTPTPQALAFWILDPHPRMNLTLTRREAEDIAAYINTLAK
jgi:mono/diheme cytochrome c family protein